MKPKHLSPSALEGYDFCPEHRYAANYVGARKPMIPTFAMSFGNAVHFGIEHAYLQDDYELAFLREWRRLHGELEAAKVSEDDLLEDRTYFGKRGLEMIQSALALGIPGTPEWSFRESLPGLAVPVSGRVDLIDRKGAAIWDWKSTGRPWTQKQADAKVWQPALYGSAYHKLYDAWPEFSYVILPVAGGEAYVLKAPRSEEQITAALARAQEILEAIWRDEYPCTCPAWAKKARAA